MLNITMATFNFKKLFKAFFNGSQFELFFLSFWKKESLEAMYRKPASDYAIVKVDQALCVIWNSMNQNVYALIALLITLRVINVRVSQLAKPLESVRLTIIHIYIVVY